jgi:5-oxoprolinase (ATP-hydrolysing)
MPKNASQWKFAVDRGGTFTDVIGVDPAGEFHILKLLSHSSQYRDASIEGIRRVLKISSHEPLPEKSIDRIRFGTTVATNTLLERKGGIVVLFITRGFSDLIEIGYQNRPDIFQLCIKKVEPLCSHVTEMDERIDHRGNVLKSLDTQLLLNNIVKLKESRIDTIAVVLMHAWKNPVHELLCEKILHEHGIQTVILSHKTINLINNDKPWAEYSGRCLPEHRTGPLPGEHK